MEVRHIESFYYWDQPLESLPVFNSAYPFEPFADWTSLLQPYDGDLLDIQPGIEVSGAPDRPIHLRRWLHRGLQLADYRC